MSIKIKVRAVSETVVGDTEIQYHSHRSHHVRKVSRQLNIPTMSTPTFSYMLCFHCMCFEEKVRKLINLPVVSLFFTRMIGQITKVVTILFLFIFVFY